MIERITQGHPDYFCQYCYDKGLRYPEDGLPWRHGLSCPKHPGPREITYQELEAQLEQTQIELETVRETLKRNSAWSDADYKAQKDRANYWQEKWTALARGDS